MKGANPSTPTDYFVSFPWQGQVISQQLWTFLLATLPLESPFCSGMSCAEIGFIFQKILRVSSWLQSSTSLWSNISETETNPRPLQSTLHTTWIRSGLIGATCRSVSSSNVKERNWKECHQLGNGLRLKPWWFSLSLSLMFFLSCFSRRQKKTFQDVWPPCRLVGRIFLAKGQPERAHAQNSNSVNVVVDPATPCLQYLCLWFPASGL